MVAAAERGQPTLITRHGQPAAMVVPVEAGRRLYPTEISSFAAHLLAIPEPLEVERDVAPIRALEL